MFCYTISISVWVSSWCMVILQDSELFAYYFLLGLGLTENVFFWCVFSVLRFLPWHQAIAADTPSRTDLEGGCFFHIKYLLNEMFIISINCTKIIISRWFYLWLPCEKKWRQPRLWSTHFLSHCNILHWLMQWLTKCVDHTLDVISNLPISVVVVQLCYILLDWLLFSCEKKGSS